MHLPLPQSLFELHQTISNIFPYYIKTHKNTSALTHASTSIHATRLAKPNSFIPHSNKENII